MSIAHSFKDIIRTDDVLISESVDFSGLLLSSHVLQGLTEAGFKRPSPIQLKAIPLGRCGLDLIVQAKSGTGKTCVFTVVALESLELKSTCLQVLVLAPTREIALQIQQVVQTIGKPMKGLSCYTFIGGLPVHADKMVAKSCHIAVGTPGRVKQLIEIGALKTNSIRLFILDEADKLLEEGFQESINWIYSTLPGNKQILALSATYPEQLAQHLTAYMRNPTFVRLNITDPALLGIKQYHVVVPEHPMPNIVFSAKTEAVVKILSSVSFQQCLIFSNLQIRAQNLQSELQSRNWPTACIAGKLDQKDRNVAMEQLKSYKCRILISTDLTSRGIDADKVNLVINLDVPPDHETYLHRIGRAGRFGSYGAAVTIVTKGHQETQLWAVEKKCKTYIHKLPDPIPNDLVTKPVPLRIDDIVSTQQIINQPVSEQGASLGAPTNNAPNHFQETFTSFVSHVVLQGSEEQGLSYTERLMAVEAVNDESTRDTASADEHAKSPNTGLLGLSGTPLSDKEPAVLREDSSNSGCGFESLSLHEAAVTQHDSYSAVDTNCRHEISTEICDYNKYDVSADTNDLKTLEHADSALALSSVDYSEESVVPVKNITLNPCADFVVSQSDESKHDGCINLESGLSEEYLESKYLACVGTAEPENHVNCIETTVKSKDSGLLQESKGDNTSLKNIEPKTSQQYSSIKCQSDVSGSLYVECEPVLCSKTSEEDVDGLLKTNDISECHKSSCSDLASSGRTMMNVQHNTESLQKIASYIDTISKEIFSEAISESKLVNVKAGLLGSTEGDNGAAGDIISDNVEPLHSTKSTVGAVCNSQPSDRINTLHETGESPLIATGACCADKINNENGLQKVLEPLSASTDIHNDNKCSAKILQITDKTLGDESALNKSHTVPRKRGKRGHMRSFALTDFLQSVNEDLSLLQSKKISQSPNVADEKYDGNNTANLSADFGTTTPECDPFNLNGGGDFIDVSCSLPPSKLHLACGTSLDVSDMSGGKAANNNSCDLYGGLNNGVDILNGSKCCTDVYCKKSPEPGLGQHLECTQPYGHENGVGSTESSTVNLPTNDTEPKTVVDFIPSSTSQVFNNSKALLAAYLSSLLLPSQNQPSKFADLEADHMKFCKDFDNNPTGISCASELMKNLMIDNFVDSKDLQHICRFEAEKLAALKSKFQDKLVSAQEKRKAAPRTEAKQKLRSNNEGDHQMLQSNTDSSRTGKTQEELSQPEDQMYKKQQAKQGPKQWGRGGRGKKFKGSDSLNWRSGASVENFDVRERQTDKEHYFSPRKDVQKQRWNQKNEHLNEGERVQQEVGNKGSSVAKTPYSRQKPMLNQSEQDRACHELDERHENMLENSREAKNDKLKGQDVSKFGNVNPAEGVRGEGTDTSEREYSKLSEHKDDECKMLDDMHTQMLMRRKQRKLGGSNLSSGSTSHASDVDIITDLKFDDEARTSISAEIVNKVGTELTEESADKEMSSRLEDDVVVEHLTSDQTGHEHRLVLGVKPTQYVGEESKHSAHENSQTSHHFGESQVREEDSSRRTTLNKEQRKQTAAESDRVVKLKHLSNSPGSQSRPTKISKSEARVAGLEVSDGTTSSTSDPSLSSASDISDVNSSDVMGTQDVILTSQCYANKYAHENFRDKKDGNPSYKKKVAKNIPINSSICNKHNHNEPLQESTARLASYSVQDDFPFEEYTVSNVSAVSARSQCSTAVPQPDHKLVNCDQYLQDSITERPPISLNSGSKYAKLKTHKYAEPGHEFQHVQKSQTQKHHGETSDKRRLLRTKANRQSPSENSRHSHKLDTFSADDSYDEYSRGDHTDYISHPFLADNPYFYSHHGAESWFQPHSSVPHSVWQYRYPSQEYYGVMQSPPLPFYAPPTKLSPHPYPSFHHYNQLSQFYNLQPNFQHQTTMWDYVSLMTKMLSYLSRKHRQARMYGKE